MANITEQGDIIARIILQDQDYVSALDRLKAKTKAIAKRLSEFWSKATDTMAKRTQIDTNKMSEAKAKADREMVKSNKDAAGEHKDIADSLMSHWISRFGKIAIGFTIWYRAINALEAAIGALKDELIDTIKVIDDFEKETLGAAAAVASFAKTDDPFTTYSKVLPLVRKQMNELEIVAARHLVTAEELRLAYASFIKKGVFAVTKEDVRNLATMSDAIKLFAREAGGVHQIQQEIFSLMEGQRGKGRELVYVFQAMYPELKNQIDAWKQMGKDIDGNNILLKQLANSVAGLKAAQVDIYKLYQTQISSLKTYWSLIKRIGGDLTYKRISDDLRRINESLIGSEGPSETLLALAEEWHRLISSVYRILKSISRSLVDLAPLLTTINKIIEGWSYLFTVLSGVIRTVIILSDSFDKKFLKRHWFSQITIDADTMEKELSDVFDRIKKGSEDIDYGLTFKPTMKLFPESAPEGLDFDKMIEGTKKSLKDMFIPAPGTKDKIVKVWEDVERDLLMIFKHIKEDIDENLFPDAATVEDSLEKQKEAYESFLTLKVQLMKKARYDQIAIETGELMLFERTVLNKIESLKKAGDIGKREITELLTILKQAYNQMAADISVNEFKRMSKEYTTFHKMRLSLLKKTGAKYEIERLQRDELEVFRKTMEDKLKIWREEENVSRVHYEQLLSILKEVYEYGLEEITSNARKAEFDNYKEFLSMAISLGEEAGYSKEVLMREEIKLSREVSRRRVEDLKREHKITGDMYISLMNLIEERYYEKMQVFDGSLMDGMKKGWGDFFEDLGTTFEWGVELTNDLASGMYAGLKSGFFDLAKGDIEDFGDFFEDMLDGMLRAVSDYVAKVTMELVVGGLFEKGERKGKADWLETIGLGALGMMGSLKGGSSSAGGSTYLNVSKEVHGGGLVTSKFSKSTLHNFNEANELFTTNLKKHHSGGTVMVQNLPRAHGGMFIGDLKAREVPIIAEEGEKVLPRGMEPTPKATIVNIMATDAASFYDLARRNPKAITDQLVRAIDGGDKEVISKLRSII